MYHRPLMKGRFFSAGYDRSPTSVHTVTDAQRLRFPSADLVRYERSTNPFFYKLLFYKHRIARLLYPDQFIEVVGAVTEARPGGEDSFAKDHLVFSRKAPVPDEHATFAAHMEIDDDGPKRLKKSLCKCSVCVSHRRFHRDHDISMKAFDASSEFWRRGITVPWDDDSDYCMTDKEKILFFEIDGMDYRVLQNNIDDVDDPAVRDTIEKMSARYGHFLRLLDFRL